MTDWYNLTDFEPDKSKYDNGELLAIEDNNQTCVDKFGQSNSSYYLFNLKGTVNIFKHVKLISDV